jgi:hypothetical protein
VGKDVGSVELSTAIRVNQKLRDCSILPQGARSLAFAPIARGRRPMSAIELKDCFRSMGSRATFPRRFLMTAELSDLVVGEIIEIKYRVPRPSKGDGAGADLDDRWITAKIIHRDADCPPMARLADGQLTDIRAYMTWRKLPA